LHLLVNDVVGPRVNPVTGQREERGIASCLFGCRLARTFGLVCIVGGCSGAGAAPRAQPGAPWPGLGQADLQAFAIGRDLFHREFTPQDGLGPTFNDARCSSCHDVPTLGGSGVEGVQKATRFEAGQCDLLQDQGGDVFQHGVTLPLHARGYQAEPISRRANAIVTVAPPPLYGLGAIEAVPEREILERADAQDRDRDGISGRPGRTADGALGRFGRKATFASIRHFVERAFVEEMGLTSARFPEEESLAGHPLPADSDPVHDPEIDSVVVDRVTRYIQLLAFPAVDSTLLVKDSTRAGARLFQRIGCAACHTPELRIEAAAVRTVGKESIPLYSDLLLHDLGAELATVCAPGVEPGEWRTAPLVGLRLRPKLLHDGRTQSVESVIRLHGGEGASSRLQYEKLKPEQQQDLLRFLRSL
jgi:CxxC motif-containing protein (DUF1111 family)